MASVFKGPHNGLKEFREALRKSQTELAKVLGIPQTTYAHYESKPDVRIPSQILQQLADMGLNLHWLFTGVGNMVVGKNQEEATSTISVDHVVEAYTLTRAGLRKHSMSSALSEARLVAHVAEGLSQGMTAEEVLRDFEEAIQKVVNLRNRHRK